MRKTRRHKPKIKQLERKTRINNQIRVPQVRVVDENGENLGILATAEALAIAEERGFDLVEISPKVNPPITKFLDFGSYQYKKDKLMQKQKSGIRKSETKGIRLSTRIGEHDILVRLKQAEKFLAKGDKLKIELVLKGRERQHPELARDMINNFIKRVEEIMEVVIDQPLTKQGGKFFVTLYKKK